MSTKVKPGFTPPKGNFVLRCKRCKGGVSECQCTARQMVDFDKDRAVIAAVKGEK